MIVLFTHRPIWCRQVRKSARYLHRTWSLYFLWVCTKVTLSCGHHAELVFTKWLPSVLFEVIDSSTVIFFVAKLSIKLSSAGSWSNCYWYRSYSRLHSKFIFDTHCHPPHFTWASWHRGFSVENSASQIPFVVAFLAFLLTCLVIPCRSQNLIKPGSAFYLSRAIHKSRLLLFIDSNP